MFANVKFIRIERQIIAANVIIIRHLQFQTFIDVIAPDNDYYVFYSIIR